jgi:hypothetical protein
LPLFIGTLIGAPEEIRTPDPQIRSLWLSGADPTYDFVHVSVPWVPRSVRRDHLPESEPSGLMFTVRITVRPLLKQATARTSPITWPTPTGLPLWSVQLEDSSPCASALNGAGLSRGHEC